MVMEKFSNEDALRQHMRGWSLHWESVVANLTFVGQNGPWFEFKIKWLKKPEDTRSFFKELRERVDHGENIFLISTSGEKASLKEMVISGNDVVVGIRDYRINTVENPWKTRFMEILEKGLSFLR